MDDDSELDIPEMIEVTLCRVNAVIDTVWADDDDDEPDEDRLLYFKSREQLSALLKRLNGGLVTPEYAEVELEKIQYSLDERLGDDQIPAEEP